MTPEALSKLFDDMQTDLNEISASKKAHIQIENIIRHYRQRGAESFERSNNGLKKVDKGQRVGAQSESQK